MKSFWFIIFIGTWRPSSPPRYMMWRIWMMTQKSMPWRKESLSFMKAIHFIWAFAGTPTHLVTWIKYDFMLWLWTLPTLAFYFVSDISISLHFHWDPGKSCLRAVTLRIWMCRCVLDSLTCCSSWGDIYNTVGFKAVTKKPGTITRKCLKNPHKCHSTYNFRLRKVSSSGSSKLHPVTTCGNTFTSLFNDVTSCKVNGRSWI